MWPRIVPFAAYMGFIALNSLAGWAGEGSAWQAQFELWSYPVKTAVVLGLLIYFWPRYDELKGRAFAGAGELALVVVVGLVVYAAWVRMDWPWAIQGEVAGYDPFADGGGMGALLAGVRIFGAAIVVPLMEELFWRSFIIRYLISPDFAKVPIGAFAPVSFIATVVLFGVEHNLWLAGMMAGVAYNLLLYKTKNLWSCVVAHGITNLVLGIHVLVTEEWQWW